MTRIPSIDISRGILILLMINSHALGQAHVDAGHWLHSDLWLPNGWATSLFVTLSGYAGGFLYATRRIDPSLRHALRRRSLQLLAVMWASNAFFGLLQVLMSGDSRAMGSPHWWLGFVSADHTWTISAVLLPTATLMLLMIGVVESARRAEWTTLVALIGARALATVLADQSTAESSGALTRFLLTDGLGGFPLLPMVLDGCIGVWLGAARRRNLVGWPAFVATLMAVQLFVYLGSLSAAPPPLWSFTMHAFGGIAKLPWVLIVAQLLSRHTGGALVHALEKIGCFSLASFVLHRLFLHVLRMATVPLGSPHWPPEWLYALLFIGTLALTWLLAAGRDRLDWLNHRLRQMAM